MHSPILAPVVILVGWTMVMWAWMYATRIPAVQVAKMRLDPGMRVVHSLVQATWNKIEVRFSLFFLSSLVLIAMTVRAAQVVL